MARAPALEHDRSEGSFGGGFERTQQNSPLKHRSVELSCVYLCW
jgi:hypothetical protein